MADTVIVVLLGQSLNAFFSGTRALETGWAGARQLVGGGSVVEMDFYGSDTLGAMDWNETTSVVTQAESTGGQSPISGIALQLSSTGLSRAYLCSIAVGNTSITAIRARGCIVNLYAVLDRLVSLAASDGYTNPAIYFYSAHGENDAANATTDGYYADAIAYYRRCQLAASQAISAPNYVAPIILSLPIQNKSPTALTDASDDIAIKTAIRNIADDLDGAILLGSLYQWPTKSDIVHPTEDGYVLRGEAVGRVIKNHLNGSTYAPLRISRASLSGDTVTCEFSANIVRDATTLGDVGSNLSGTDGFEYFDNGSSIAISNISYSGNTATITLASTPAGAFDQQELRVGCQPTPSSSALLPETQSGSVVRKDNGGWVSAYDGTYTNYDWAIQESVFLPYTSKALEMSNLLKVSRGAVEPAESGATGNEVQLWRGAVEPAASIAEGLSFVRNIARNLVRNTVRNTAS